MYITYKSICLYVTLYRHMSALKNQFVSSVFLFGVFLIKYDGEQLRIRIQQTTITHVLLVTLVCKNKYRAPSRCIHDPTFRHSSLVSSSGVI